MNKRSFTYVVKDADEVFFSPFIKVTDFSRSDTGLIFKQVDGQVLNSNVPYKLFHKVKDAKEIQEIIKDLKSLILNY